MKRMIGFDEISELISNRKMLRQKLPAIISADISS